MYPDVSFGLGYLRGKGRQSAKLIKAHQSSSKLIKVHRTIVLLHIAYLDEPFVAESERLTCKTVDRELGATDEQLMFTNFEKGEMVINFMVQRWSYTTISINFSAGFFFNDHILHFAVEMSFNLLYFFQDQIHHQKLLQVCTRPPCALATRSL